MSADKQTLLWVEWLDSVSCGAVWTSTEDAPADNLGCSSIGWLIRENDDSITIASHRSPSQVGGDMTIPKIAITGRWEIVL